MVFFLNWTYNKWWVFKMIMSWSCWKYSLSPGPKLSLGTKLALGIYWSNESVWAFTIGKKLNVFNPYNYPATQLFLLSKEWSDGNSMGVNHIGRWWVKRVMSWSALLCCGTAVPFMSSVPSCPCEAHGLVGPRSSVSVYWDHALEFGYWESPYVRHGRVLGPATLNSYPGWPFPSLLPQDPLSGLWASWTSFLSPHHHWRAPSFSL